MRIVFRGLIGTMAAVFILVCTAACTLYLRDCAANTVRGAVASQIAELQSDSDDLCSLCRVSCAPVACDESDSAECEGTMIDANVAAVFIEELSGASPEERKLWSKLMQSGPSAASVRRLIGYYREKSTGQTDSIAENVQVSGYEIRQPSSPPAPLVLFATRTSAELPLVATAQEITGLELKTVAFCHKIRSFGDYEPFAQAEFTAGQEVLLYVDIGKFRSRLTEDGKFQTVMKSTVEICRAADPFDPSAAPVERIDLPETIDNCRVVRHDYFHSYQFTIPAKLTPGPYVVRLSVHDQLGNSTANRDVPFTVVSFHGGRLK